MGSEPRLLVVDDDALIREELEGLFASQPYLVDCVESVPDAIERLSAAEFALALVDVRIGGKDGIELTRHIRDRWPEVDVIMITGHGSIENAVDAMKHGAVDYITKPFQSEEILMATEKALERRQMLAEIEYLRKQLQDRYSFANMVSRNPEMLEVFSTLEMLARNDVTVLITGESGTGKELAARAIHYQGKRKSARFVAINCAALPENLLESELFGYERGAFTGAVADRVGKIEHADGGTLFLDEVETISPAMQAKLLRVLEERAIERLGGNKRIDVDMRVVSATNENLDALVKDGRMREDFYYRINVVPVHLPPLRERVEDISLLVSEFLRSNPLAREKGLNRLSEKALHQLVSYEWPGNIRELSNVLERAILRAKGDTIREVDVPTGKAAERNAGPKLSYDMELREYIKGAERDYLSRLLTKHRGSISPCAKQASVDQATLHRKIKAHGLRANDFRQNGRSDEGR